MTEMPADDRLRYRVLNDEVLFAAEALVRLDRKTVQFLKEKALANNRRRIRLCAHQDVQDPLHEMLIVHTRDTYVRPHKHLNKCESFHVIEGTVDVVVFDESGSIGEVISLGDYSSGRMFYYRLSYSYFHTLLIRSEVLVFHETTNGPFKRSDTIFASWAPEDGDEDARRKYMEQLAQAVETFKPG